MSMIELETARLSLHQPQRGDLEGLVAMMAPEAVRRFLGNRPATHDDQFARLLRNAGCWSLYGYGTFVVRRRPEFGDAERIIGLAGVFHTWRGFGQGMDDVPEAGWIMAEDVWGEGFAGEAMRAAIAWFDANHGPARIACMIDPENAPSLRLAARLGFVRYGEHTMDDDAVVVLLERGV